MSTTSKRNMEEFGREIGEQAEREAEAQLRLVRALKPFSQEQRRNILEAIRLLLEADKLVPGLFNAVGRGLSGKPEPEGGAAL